MIVRSLRLLPEKSGFEIGEGRGRRFGDSPSIELALTSCAQSTSSDSGMASQDAIDSGRRRYTCAEESLST